MNVSDNPANNTPIHDNTHRHRFEVETRGKLSILEYQAVDDETLALTHTEVDPSLEGKGVGSYLVHGAFEQIEQQNLKIVPLCPFVVTYLKRHPEWQRIVSTAYSAADF